MAEGAPLHGATRTRTLQARHVNGDSKQRSAAMTATLSAELEDRVPPGLVAEIVRAVLDEGRENARGRSDEVTMFEARQRLERFIRARTAR